MHRDINPNNIFTDLEDEDLIVSVGDLGFALDLNKYPDPEFVICGTMGYIDPEVLNGEQYTIKSDIFSVGSLMYYIITGKRLFKGRNSQAVGLLNKRCNINSQMAEIESLVSPECLDLLV